ncbi:MAG TPA: hypothetical protein VJP02_16605 [Candidatus Sulfotelmatobacter sp.]|nr:hypothetical protein [Candidatus Sulfotelmatobacter sp.]
MGLGRDFLDIMKGKGLNPDGVGQDSERTKSNKKSIDALTVESAFDKFLRHDALDVHEANRLACVMFRQVRNEREHALTQYELLADAWITHHGPITEANKKEFARSVMRFAKRIQAVANAKREAAEWRAMQGPLGEFEDLTVPMGGLPGDSEFEAEILKEQPELKKFKR